MPESSLYRQSTEALTRHRLSIISAAEPEGHAAWSEKAQKTIVEHPEVFNTPAGGVPHDESKHVKVTKLGQHFVVSEPELEVDDTREEWDSEVQTVGFSSGGMSEEDEAKDQGVMDMERPGSDTKTVELDPEPQLTADQYVPFGMGSVEMCINAVAGS